MSTFEMKGKKKKVQWIFLKQIIWVWLSAHIMVLLLNVRWYIEHWLLIQLIALAPALLWMLYKKERNLYSISFDEERRVCIVHYYIYFAWKIKREFSYEKIHFRYGRTIYMRRLNCNALQLMKGPFLIVEVREKYNIGWTNEEITTVWNYIKESKSFKIKEYPLIK